MKFGINQAISQTITQLSCIQLETPSSRLWNFWWIKTYTTFKTLIWLVRRGEICKVFSEFKIPLPSLFFPWADDLMVGAITAEKIK